MSDTKSRKLSIPVHIGYWAASARPFMLGPLDGYSVFPVLLFLLHIRYWTLALLCVVLVIAFIMNRLGYPLNVLLRSAITRIGGRRVRRMPGLGHRKIWR